MKKKTGEKKSYVKKKNLSILEKKREKKLPASKFGKKNFLIYIWKKEQKLQHMGKNPPASRKKVLVIEKNIFILSEDFHSRHFFGLRMYFFGGLLFRCENALSVVKRKL